MFVAIYSGGDPDLQIREGAVIQTRPEIRGEGTVSKKILGALWVSFWSKSKGAGPRAPPMDPPGKINYVWEKEYLLK